MRPNEAFLLAQVGAHSAEVFAKLLARLDLSPPHSGIVWMLNRAPGVSQQRMAAALNIHPSRLVALLDELEARGLIERKGDANDRRLHALHLTKTGDALFDQRIETGPNWPGAVVLGSIDNAEPPYPHALMSATGIARLTPR